MAIIKAVNSRASVGRAVNYITREEKTQDRIVSGLNCDPTRAVDEMKATKELWGKLDGRQYKHYIQSFAEGEAVTPEQVHKIGVALAEKQFAGFEVVVATHTDKGHLHNHFIVNSVSFADGHKFRQDKRWLQQMKNRSDDLCREQGLSICERGRTFDGREREDMTAWNKDKYNLIERADQGKVKSYVLDTALAVMQAREQSTSRADFISKMREQGYATEWADNRKHIVFQNEQGKKVRASNLEKTFKIELSKEGLEREFAENVQRNQARATTNRAREQLRDAELNSGAIRLNRQSEPQIEAVRTEQFRASAEKRDFKPEAEPSQNNRTSLYEKMAAAERELSSKKRTNKTNKTNKQRIKRRNKDTGDR